jgi:hypothetical protein
MAYIGSTPEFQSFIAGTDYFNGNNSTTAFTLSRSVNTVNDIEVTVNNVQQKPIDAYTVSGNVLTMSAAPSTGTNNIYVRYLSTRLQSMNESGSAKKGMFYENKTTLTDSYTITPGYNAMSAGPININNGVIVDIPGGSVWTIV